ncbi:uncharacterized protein K452DRAFT_6557 [Aplosporella prunicola CBS 121167]|uniref:Uncharacterized protein n=1 Tax=Aplosporella prunicola CBS 121167 TaxID=1176127 RepID=A0A6A6BVT0_9PEZI|nr:uncharacterized protein K452DRAFT_6557 [Aplosporella prunicola CBS 121167]KAF2147385.1 hypothetical protein K452DRAFT_6557 [Aplosporella prunicola CBS 121167]
MRIQGLKLLIKVAATMILGMPNTYPQLLTTLKATDPKYALSNVESQGWGLTPLPQVFTNAKAAWAIDFSDFTEFYVFGMDYFPNFQQCVCGFPNSLYISCKFSHCIKVLQR